MAHHLLFPRRMDMTALARLHAALDHVLETEEQLDALDAGSPMLQRARFLTGETRELLRALLATRPSGSGGGAVRPLAARRIR